MIKLSDVKVRIQYRRRVRFRLMVLHHAALHGSTAASRRFGVSVRTIRRWRAAGGLRGSLGWCRGTRPAASPGCRQTPSNWSAMPATSSPTARPVHACGWLVCTASTSPWPPSSEPPSGRPAPAAADAKARPSADDAVEMPNPGDSVQVDVKYVRLGGRWVFQYTALDDCTRLRVLRLYRRLHQRSSLAFLGELRRAFPFPVRRQCDNGREFPLEFSLAVQEAGSQHQCIQPRRPQQNGKVERSHRIDNEEF